MIDRKSGYDPATQVCWQFHNKGDDWRHKRPACSAHYRERELFYFGRCRSGQRWFWQTHCIEWGEAPLRKKFGWADSEELATAAAMTAVIELRTPESLVVANLSQGTASRRLKELNTEKRAARPAPDTSDTHVVEYLYGSWYDNEDCKSYPYRFQITKKTAKRIFYSRGGERIDDFGVPQYARDRDDTIGYVNRQKLEADGEVHNRGVHWCMPDSTLHISLQHLLATIRRQDQEPHPDLKTLKAEMAAAHPDKGGSSAAFIAARKAYVEARRRARAMS
jgi:hypothetical protein